MPKSMPVLPEESNQSIIPAMCLARMRITLSLSLSHVVPGNMTFHTSNVYDNIDPTVCFGTFIAASIRRECARTFKFKLGSATDESLQQRESKPEAQKPNSRTPAWDRTAHPHANCRQNSNAGKSEKQFRGMNTELPCQH